jgi:UDP-N-acetyl-D-mannosaminuronic acid transferase (WecB/TagA/CpsF family)
VEELPWKRRDVERWVSGLLSQLGDVLTELFQLKAAQAARDAAADSMRRRTERAEAEALISVNAQKVAETAHGREVNDALQQLAAARQQLADLRDQVPFNDPY